MIKKILCASLILISLGNVIAQGTDQDQLAEITYDYTKDQLTGKMPFDDYFRIIYKGIKSKEIKWVYFFEIEYKKDSVKLKSRKDKWPEGTKFTETATRLQILKIEKNKEHKNSSQSTISPLDPERSYVIAISKENSKENHLIFNELLALIRKPATIVELNAFFKKSIVPLNDNLEKFKIDIISFPEELSDFIEQAEPVINFYKDDNNRPVLKDIPLKASIDSTLIAGIANNLKDKKIKSKIFNKIVPMFYNNESDKIHSFSYGLNEKTEEYNYDKRIEKLGLNLKTLDSLKKEIETLQLLENDSIVNLFYTDFVKTSLETLKENQSNLNAFNVKLKEKINSAFPEIILINALTMGGKLETSNSNSLVPDVGLVNAVGHNSRGDLRYIGRPYLGINWHFSGINREQYLREIPNRKFRHRWSLALGITLGKIDNEDYEDLYSGISPTVGMNFRWTRQIRTGAGVLLVREKNRNPIVDNTKVVVAPYISVSFDLGLFSEASKLTKLIGF